MKIMSIIRDKFNNLTFKRDAPYPKGVFQCICGKVVTVNKYDVIRGAKKSCGCQTLNDRRKSWINRVFDSVKGKKFNNVEIQKYAYTRNNKTFWECRCFCGNSFTVVLGNIKSGMVRSCGCLRTHKFASGESGLKKLFMSYKKSARRCGRLFKLSILEFKELTSQNCTYCGEPPQRLSQSERTKKIKIKKYTSYKFNGLDRVDSNKGYLRKNVVPCCFWCNVIKRERTVSELKTHINKIHDYFLVGSK